MNLPDKLNRKAVKLNFTKLSNETWEYLFDYEKQNGLAQCRTPGWGVKHAWYATKSLKGWLIEHCYYTPEDFEPRQHRRASPWSALLNHA
jgi:hypothetical protein